MLKCISANSSGLGLSLQRLGLGVGSKETPPENLNNDEAIGFTIFMLRLIASLPELELP